MLRENVQPKDLPKFAFSIFGKLEGRQTEYMKYSALNGYYGGELRLHKLINRFNFYLQDFNLYIYAPSVDTIQKTAFIDFQLDTILFTIVFFMFLVDAIVIYSQMIMDVEERTYEFAMLRTLGF